uniref:Nuclear pore complex protein Nup85 n=1 Tax=Kalanchoe fedtschenkoi TaxID=63787 RepID=A0A7N0T5D4_KALFE
MPGVVSNSDVPSSNAVVPFSTGAQEPVIYPIRHGVAGPIHRLAISWGAGNNLRVSFFGKPDSDDEIGGKVVEVKLSADDPEIESDAERRRIAYGSVSPFAHLQSRRNSVSLLSKISPSPYNIDWWEYVMEYSKDIKSLLSSPNTLPESLFEDPRTIIKKTEDPTFLKAAWELIEIFYADKESQSWLPERMVDWLADFDSLFSVEQVTVHSKLVDFQEKLINLQSVEDDPRYWQSISSALALGWLDTVVKMLRLHGSYNLDQLNDRETENGLVEAVAVLISKMPRRRPELASGMLGEKYMSKPDFMKSWEKWRAQLTKLNSSAYWIHCSHHQTREGLKSMLQIMLGDVNSLSIATHHWIELFISQLLYIRPLSVGLESMYSLAQKCIQLKPSSTSHKLVVLMMGILEENTEVVLAECSRSFSPWMVAHAIELLTAGSDEADFLLNEDRSNLGGISIKELYRLIYAQVLSSHPLTWQIAPIYLASCMKQGMALLEILLSSQPVHNNNLLLKILEICRLYELDSVSTNMMKVAGVHHWKQGRKGLGVYWLQQARDEVRLNRIAQTLFDFVGKSISEENFKEWEGLIELLGADSRSAGSLDFLYKYRDFKRSLQRVTDGKNFDACQQAVDSLISLMKSPSTPHRFWLPLLYDSVTTRVIIAFLVLSFNS